jgi:hypothetical protein
MKVVCCKNCGAKYQLEDNDDITTFECSSCAGDLEYLEDDSNNENSSNPPYIDSFKYDDSFIVQCKECGLKYKIKSSDSILDYECDSCGGSLRYLDDEMNKELDKYLEERKEEIKQIRRESKSNENDEVAQKEPKSIKSLTNKLEHFFSEERMLQIADDERKQRELEEEVNVKTARTTIPYAVQSKFGREFAVPKTNDYNVLKNFLKDEFFKGMEEYYPKVNDLKQEEGSFFDKLIIKEPENEEVASNTSDNQQADSVLDMGDVSTNQYFIAIGGVIFVLSIFEILFINSGIGIVALFIGVILLCYGLYKNQDVKETEERTRIIREHLLTLPEEYYVFYNVKTPTSSSGINHLVVGPTGIYALLSHKYNPKLKLESENENLNFMSSTELNDDKLEEFSTSGRRRFRYTTKQAKFSQDDKIKQKALYLGEDLINFLNDNNIRNCFVEPLVGFINNQVVVINTPLTDEDLFIDELLYQIQTGTIKLDQETIDKCAVLINKYSADCSAEI